MVPYFSSRQLSAENDMWLFPGKGPSQRLGDGNGIFNKWPGKLLILVPFLGLQFLCPESLSNHLRLLKWKQEYWNCVHCCMLFCLEHLLSIYHDATLLTLSGCCRMFVVLLEQLGQMQRNSSCLLLKLCCSAFTYVYICFSPAGETSKLNKYLQLFSLHCSYYGSYSFGKLCGPYH